MDVEKLFGVYGGVIFSEAEGRRNMETLVAELKKHHLKCTLDAGILGET